MKKMRKSFVVRSDGDTVWVGIPRPIVRQLRLRRGTRLKVRASGRNKIIYERMMAK
jgi:antitoxin component of MazEF toxin-antitoxin module